MASVLQNATVTGPPSSSFQDLLVSNMNYALLFLVLSGIYMGLTHRKVLFSVKIQDLKEAGNILHYVGIAVVQGLGITMIQSALVSMVHYRFVDFGMTGVLLIILGLENAILERWVSG